MSTNQRVLKMARIYLQPGKTLRDAASAVGVSVWTAHRDLTVRLPQIDQRLARLVQTKIKAQRRDRARRGGLATRGVARWRGWKGVKWA